MATSNGVKQSLKILMLHGYTQSGPLFDAKTKALQKALLKSFPGTTFNYLTGPLRLDASSIPGYDAAKYDSNEDGAIESYGWWRRSNTAEPPEYVGLEDGLSAVAKTLANDGPFDGVMGFSQGAAMATLVTSLLEGGSRKDAFEAARVKSKLAIPFPASFALLDHPPLKFCVVYAGFVAPGERYTAFYEPPIKTSVCHFIGSLDTLVGEDRTGLLIKATGGEKNTSVVVHPGGHFVPNNRQYVDALVAFVKAKAHGEEALAETKEEESVEDMEVPF